MAELLIHPSAGMLLRDYAATPTHAILLAGEKGVGLNTIAHDLARKITKDLYITEVLPEEGKSSISIDSIRALYALAKIKDEHPRLIIIDNADLMRVEAQNALLKLLEEPTPHVHFILTSHDPQLMLPTVHSRVQTIMLRPLGQRDTLAFLDLLNVQDATKAKQIAFIANGLPAEMKRLADDDKYFQQKSAKAGDARTFLGAKTYERLILVAKYGSRDEALEFLSMLGRFTVHTLYSQPGTANSKRLEALAAAVERIVGNGNVRTQLTRLVAQWS